MSPGYALLADLLVVLHLGFVLFAVLGGLLCLWRAKMAWLHLPAAVWAAGISFGGWVCPLTHWEAWLRYRAGQGGYSGGFVEHYLEPVLYPTGLTHLHQIGLGLGVMVLNLFIYARVLKQKPRQKG